jgi:hypothetical protein
MVGRTKVKNYLILRLMTLKNPNGIGILEQEQEIRYGEKQ